MDNLLTRTDANNMELTPTQVWQQVGEYLKSEGELTPFVMKQYLYPLEALNISNETILIRVPNEMTRNVLENRYHNAIISAVKFVTKTTDTQVANVKFITTEEERLLNEDAKTVIYGLPSDKENLTASLNPRYTFENFVAGENNQLALAASIAVAKNPAEKYNPLFIYGGAGMGKTHLMQAIVHYLRTEKPELKVVYITSERFTNEFIEAIKNSTNIRFRNKYRKIDVLLLDDIQFLSGKEQTQEEFFHTFNELYEAQKQVVISSDKHPKNIPGLEARMQTRFEWGLTVDIQPPSFETRVAILKRKADDERLFVETDVLEYIAEKVVTSVRELEGILMRLKAQSELLGPVPTIDTIASIMGENILKSTKTVSVESIIQLTCKHYSVSYSDILTNKRPASLATARQVAMYLTRELTELSLPEIGKAFGGKDHSTVFYACNKIKESLTRDAKLKKDVEDITLRLREL